MKTWLGLLLLGMLVGCQVASGISSLEIQASTAAGDGGKSGKEPDMAGAGRGGGGGGEMAGISGGAGSMAGVGGVPPEPPCERRDGDDCRYLEQECGCKEPQHCQVRGAEAKATCVKRGDRKVGEPCKTPDDCREGTCDQRVCRKYCENSCDGGKCLPATGSDNKPIAGVNVCWKSCQAGSQDSCPSGTTCQVREASGSKGAFCLPPANPCPTTEDGKCDEPTYCASGTDTVDCSCEKQEGQMCNPIAKCGCPKGKSCEYSSTGTPTCDDRSKATAKLSEFCKDDPSCEPSLTCTFNPYGTCKAYCRDKADCPGKLDRCQAVTDRSNKDLFNVCVPGCDDTVKCPDHQACVSSEDGAFCRPYRVEVPNGTCSLSLQLGCESEPGTSCFFGMGDKSEWLSACVPWPGKAPSGAACGVNGDCESGHVCVSHVCKHFCDLQQVNAGCAKGTCGSVSYGGNNAPFGACSLPCSSDTDCSAGLRCAPLQLDESTTIKSCQLTTPLTTTCPVNNGRCDEPAPKGTGLCATGSDMADCMGAP